MYERINMLTGFTDKCISTHYTNCTSFSWRLAHAEHMTCHWWRQSSQSSDPVTSRIVAFLVPHVCYVCGESSHTLYTLCVLTSLGTYRLVNKSTYFVNSIILFWIHHSHMNVVIFRLRTDAYTPQKSTVSVRRKMSHFRPTPSGFPAICGAASPGSAASAGSAPSTPSITSCSSGSTGSSPMSVRSPLVLVVVTAGGAGVVVVTSSVVGGACGVVDVLTTTSTWPAEKMSLTNSLTRAFSLILPGDGVVDGTGSSSRISGCCIRASSTCCPKAVFKSRRSVSTSRASEDSAANDIHNRILATWNPTYCVIFWVSNKCAWWTDEKDLHNYMYTYTCIYLLQLKYM